MKIRRFQRGVAAVPWIIGAAVVVVVVWVVVNAANEAETGGTGDPAGPVAACFTKCTWFREKNCENGRDIGWCFPTWGCSDGIGAHRCEN